MRECALKGSGKKPAAASVTTLPPAVLAGRTELDLLLALSRVAKTLPIPQREKAERVAYDALAGTLSLRGD